MKKENIENLIYQGVKLFGTANVSIGGSAALMLHGLNIGCEINDVDLIIHSPTKEQYETLQKLWLIFEDTELGSTGEKRSFKLKFPAGKLDVLIAKKARLCTSSFYKILDEVIPLNSVEDVMSARRSYIKDNPRLKDLQSSLLLKQNNFNL